MDRIFNLGVDAVLITSPHNLLYYTGFTGGEGFGVISKNSKYLFVDGRYTIAAKSEAKDFTVIEYSGNVFDEIKNIAVKNLGFEDDFVSFSLYELIKDAIEIELVPVSKALNEIRAVKSESEILNIKEAEKIGDAAFLHILDFIKEGVSEKELALELDWFMRKNGAQKNSFDTIVAYGENSALPHAIPTDRSLNNNEFVLLDFGCVYNGYCGDMTRTVYFGKPSQFEKDIYELVLKAQTESIKAIKPGALCSDVDKVARDIFKSKAYDKSFSHSLGHGVGVLIHELPNLSPKSKLVLCENNVVTVEPGLYFENKFGVRIEDLCVVTSNGYINLTSSPKELIEI